MRALSGLGGPLVACTVAARPTMQISATAAATFGLLTRMACRSPARAGRQSGDGSAAGMLYAS